MTRDKLERTAAWVLHKNPGKPPAEQASLIADAVELVMQTEEDTRAEGKPVDWPIESKAPFLPAPPAKKTEAGESVVVLPDSPEGREALVKASQADPRDARMPIRVRQLGKQPEAQAGLELPQLVALLHEETPQCISITVDHPERGPMTIRLDRDVQAAVAMNAVKLVYKHADYGPDMAASETFFCNDDADIKGGLHKIQEQAQGLYSYRQRHISSATPRRDGYMEELLPGAPHGSTKDPLTAQEAGLFKEASSRHLARPFVPGVTEVE